MTEGSSRRIEVGRVISESFSMYGANAAPLLGAAVVIFAISGLMQGILNESGGFILTMLGLIISLIAQALFTGFVVGVVADVRADGRRDLGAGDLLSSAQGVIVPLIVNSILKGIAIVIGFILLIVPGLILLTIWAVTSPAIVAERVGALDAFGRSYELVRGQSWQVFGVIVVAFLIVFISSGIALAIGASIGAGATVFLAIVVSVLTAPIPALVASIVFFDLGGSNSVAGAAPGEPTAAV